MKCSEVLPHFGGRPNERLPENGSICYSVHVDKRTIDYYRIRSAEVVRRYESADMSELHDHLLRHLPPNGSILEIGCGSGRDAAFMVSKGFDVTATDASAEMVREATRAHPELEDWLSCESLPLPDGSPLLACSFDAVVSIATIMQIPDRDLFESASQVLQLLKPGGILFLSSSIGRSGLHEGRDEKGRLFSERSPEELQMLFERLGFRLRAKYSGSDIFNRDIKWFSLVFEAESGPSRSVDQIETIISHDRKVATYKLALLRALCDVAQTEQFRVKWFPDSTVRVPLGLVAERWLAYYWPLIENDIPQITGHEGGNAVSFRSSTKNLLAFYNMHGGLSAFVHDYRAGTIPPKARPLTDAALNDIASAIVSGPVTHAGGALEGENPLFGFDGRRRAKGKLTGPEAMLRTLGSIQVPASVWREMSLIGHWVSVSLILRWAELTARISKGAVPVKDVVEMLLIAPDDKRDVGHAREIYRSVDVLECVWTGETIRRNLAIDHALPFAVWRSNDLWNLLPALSAVNASKSDKLVSKQTLLESRDRIIECWELLRSRAEIRFESEICRALLRSEADATNWQSAAFSGLIENVETVALQRGLERWSSA